MTRGGETNEIKLHSFSIWTILLRQFKNPLLLIFIISTIVAFALGQKVEAFAIWAIMTVSIILGFTNEYQAAKVVNDLLKKISYTATVIRNGTKEIIPVRDVKLGDTVVLYPGVVVSADIKITNLQNLEINEAILTGESLPAAKKIGDNVFMGTVVTIGYGQGEVIAIGGDTRFGKISSDIVKVRPETEFQKGLRNFSLMLAKIAVITVAAIIVFNWLFGRPMVETILFSLTIAMGITPELLPLIVTISLSYGAKKLARVSVVVKQLVSIEDLGNMEVLCTDKTGTLTEGKIFLNSYTDIKGEKNNEVLNLALICNSAVVHKKIFGDAIDTAIWEYAQDNEYEISKKYKKVFETPFNYEKRFMTVVVKDGGEYTLIIKGSPETVLDRCAISAKEKSSLINHFKDLQVDGNRVIALASKKLEKFDGKKSVDESEMEFAGYLNLTDIPKKDVAEALKKFAHLGVRIKIVTGDNNWVAEKICRDVGFNFKKVLLGGDIEKMSDSKLENEVWQTDIFARVTPIQKTRIIEALKKGGHTVGFLGDGVNDGPALRNADIGISVNSAVDVAKDSASVVLLKKSLFAIADGIREGRTIFNNTIKYILMGTSSNFGNMFSAAGASIILPFLPMTPVQVLITDMLYDTSQLVIPTDSVDEEELVRPKSWDIAYIKRFMLFFGPISSIYDFLTFAMMFFIFRVRNSLFQTGWFIESLITEIMVVFVIRTARPFIKSKPSWQLLATCIGAISIGVYLPFSPLAKYLDFTPLPPLFFIFLIILTLTYLALVEIGKNYLNRRRMI